MSNPAVITWLFRWWLRIFPQYCRLELGFFGYAEADKLLSETAGQDIFWRIATKEEDNNNITCFVWLEKVKRIIE